MRNFFWKAGGLRAVGPAKAGPHALVTIAIAVIVLAACSGEKEQKSDAGTDAGDVTPCPWDDDDEASKANSLTIGKASEGYVCPKGDQDWYTLTMPDGNDLMIVSLSIEAPVSPVDPTYAVWDDAAKNVLQSPQARESAAPGTPLEIVHGLSAGRYMLVIRDTADDAEDVRHPYRIMVDADKDKDENEPNNDMDDATAWESTAVEAYISFRDDEDWYRFESAERGLVNLNLTMPAGGIEPKYRIIDPDGGLLVEDVNEAGKREDTDLEYQQSLASAGTYYVVVCDNDGVDSDRENAYTLELQFQEDPDVNEDNDHPSRATDLSSMACSRYWTGWVDIEGYLASSGDVDWYRINLEDCGRSIIEVDVEFAGQADLPDDLQASVRLVCESAQDECSADQDCMKLSKVCDSALDCQRIGNNCLAEGACSGAGVCMDSGYCGAIRISQSAPETVPDPDNAGSRIPNPDRGKLVFAAPLYGDTAAFIAVEDYHSDAHSIDHAYSLRVRVRRDQDLFESSEAYTAGPATDQDEIERHLQRAKEIPVHDCRAEADGGPECCGADTWVQGYLSYSYDQDWYSYTHPCPGEDCMVQVHYEFDEGPSDFYMQIFEGGTPWFDNLSDTVDMENQAARSGHFGGQDADDYCFYAFQGHAGDPFYYYLTIRDTVYISEGREEDGTWDYSSEQAYRFCVEKISSGCNDPCVLYDGGCGVPVSNN